MKNKEINKAIAESLGWKTIGGVWIGPKNRKGEEVPNYAESLDACAEFEKTIRTEDDRNLYNCELDEFIREANFSAVDHHFLLTTATPLQRCEAYLRMKGLWNERHA